MLSSHSWWKWSEPTISSTSGAACVSVSRNASTLRTHSAANGGASSGGCGAGLVVEGVVGRRDDGGQLGHRASSPSADGHLDRAAVDPQVDVHRDRPAPLLGELAEQAGGPGQQRDAAQQLHRQPEVGERGAADARPVERQRPAEHVRVHPPDRLVQPEVVAAQALLLGDAEQHRGPRVAHLVHRVAEAGHVAARLPGAAHQVQRQRVPAGVVRRQWTVVRGQRVGQEAARVLGDPEEAGPAAEQPGGQRTLQRVGRGQVGQPRGDGGRGEAVVGERDQHRLEHAYLAGRRPAPGEQPERELAEADLAHQVAGEVVAEQPDAVRRRTCPRDVG